MKTLRTILVTALAVVSVANASNALWQYYHMPILEHNDMWHRDVGFLHTREVLGTLGTSHLGYVAGPASKDADEGKFYETQFLLTPVVLRRDSPAEPLVLVSFGESNPTVPMPGLALVEDFHNGFALFRKNP